MENKVLLKTFTGFIVNRSVFWIAYTSNILIYEEIYGKAIMYTMTLCSTDLRT